MFPVLFRPLVRKRIARTHCEVKRMTCLKETLAAQTIPKAAHAMEVTWGVGHFSMVTTGVQLLEGFSVASEFLGIVAAKRSAVVRVVSDHARQ